MIKDAIKISIMTVVLLFAVNADAADLTPNELRQLLHDSIISELYLLSDVKGSTAHVLKLADRISALEQSYDATITAQLKVMLYLKSLLDENNIPITME